MKFLESSWEQHFIQESQLLEDKLSRGEITPSSSRLKMALENNIVEWSQYSVWAQQHYLLPVLKRGLYKDQLITLQKQIAVFAAEFKHYEFDKYQMIPIDKWENKIILLGLEPYDILNSGQFECILVLAPPEIITTLMGETLRDTPIISLQTTIPVPPGHAAAKPQPTDDILVLSGDEKDSSDNSLENSDDEGSGKETPLDLPSFEIQENTVNFNELLAGVTAAKPEEKPATKPAEPKKTDKKAILPDTNQYWKKISAEHNAMSASVRKYFDGYAVLKINASNNTELFRLDEELQAENLESSLFNFNLNDASFFSNLLKTNTTDSISLKMLNISVLDFNYVCATPLFLGDKPVGFILGFKINAMNEQDETALYNLLRTG